MRKVIKFDMEKLNAAYDEINKTHSGRFDWALMSLDNVNHLFGGIENIPEYMDVGIWGNDKGEWAICLRNKETKNNE